MSRADREAAARRIMEQRPPDVPPDLCAEAIHRGGRTLRRRTVLLRLTWLVLLALTVVFAVWAATVRPWEQPPADTTPPLTGW